MEQVHGSQVADDFNTRFSTGPRPLAVVAHLTRKVAMLSEDNLIHLRKAGRFCRLVSISAP
jgi:hypothetical protein